MITERGRTMNALAAFPVNADQAGLTVAALLRKFLPGKSWHEVRRIVETRRVRVGGDLCLDPARRLKGGGVFELLEKPLARPRHADDPHIRHLASSVERLCPRAFPA